MADTPIKQTPESVTHHFLKRLADSAAIGLVVVGGLTLAAYLGVLPSEFEGAGVKFRFLQTNKAVVEASDRIEALEVKVAALADALQTVPEPPSDTSSVSSNTTPRVGLENAQPLPDLVQSIAQTAARDAPTAASKLIARDTTIKATGYAWLGTWDQERRVWTDTSVRMSDGSPLLRPPDALPDGASFRTSTDLNLRSGAPERSERYYLDQTRLGFVEEGGTVTLSGPVERYLRGGVEQVWAEVTASIREPVDN